MLRQEYISSPSSVLAGLSSWVGAGLWVIAVFHSIGLYRGKHHNGMTSAEVSWIYCSITTIPRLEL